jgi:hypothetical protein
MSGRREEHPDSRGPENVDRRKGFLDIVERLGQGVVAVGLTETYADVRVSAEPNQPTVPRTPRS